MMRQVFVDTSAWIAIADGGDFNHETALSHRDAIAGSCQLVVSNYIFDELYSLMLRNQGYQETTRFKAQLDKMIATGILEMVWVTEALAAEAWAVFEKFNVDKEWSFTDCVSYVIMKQRNITEVFAFDHHFEQMGFVRKP
ncbi:MAG: type II toxin-antitoxin system VapC family toxin [bacterium]